MNFDGNFEKNIFFPKKSIFDPKSQKMMIFSNFMICPKNALKSRIFVQKLSKKFWKEFLKYILKKRRGILFSAIYGHYFKRIVV